MRRGTTRHSAPITSYSRIYGSSALYTSSTPQRTRRTKNAGKKLLMRGFIRTIVRQTEHKMLKYCIILVLTQLITGGQCEVREVFAEEGSEAVLPCRNNYPSIHSVAVAWSKANQGTVWRKQRSGLQYWGAGWAQKGSQASRVRCPHSQFEKGDYSLQINGVTEADAGFYSCILELGGHVVEKVVVLRVMKVTVSPSVPIWGKEVSLTCNVASWPYGSTVQWLLNNRPFRRQARINSDKDTGHVVREKASDKLTGNWTCVVRYKGEEGRASARVSVKGIIQPFDDNTKVYAAVGSAAALPCVFSADLTPSSPGWEKLNPGSSLSRLPASFSTTSGSQRPWDRSAAVREVMYDDQGRYRCSGTVHGQRQTRTMQLVVAKIDSNVSKKGAVTLTCQLSDTSEVTEYEWVHVTYDLNGTRSLESVQKGKIPTISKVLEQNQGEWTCRFYGKQGSLGNVTDHVQSMSGLSGMKSARASYSTPAVVMLSFLLLVLLLILAQMYKNYLRRKRIHQYPALETIVHTVSNEREEREKSRVKK
ncbi:lymphocyte activation gene 3 protein-like [Betta splendens]|uniref:Lymphocyte activation gene 3 protein-like n=1 Tax=Betta splendens TaxID=158456 RepID=A0A6P7KTF5_BETSP|nr:lymphocyte activation gene 3 protein-like [Betta splendens]